MTHFSRILFSLLLGAGALAPACSSEAPSRPDPSAVEAFDEQHADLEEPEYIQAWEDQFGASPAVVELEGTPRCAQIVDPTCQGGSNDWEISVTTGSQKYAGTDSNIYMRLRYNSANGPKWTSWKHLDQESVDNFERGRIDVFTEKMPSYSHLDRVEFRSDGAGADEGWYLEEVTLTDNCAENSWTAEFDKWLEIGVDLSAVRSLKCS